MATAARLARRSNDTAIGRDYALRLQAQVRMGNGSLPREAPVRTVVGFGSGRPCALCDHLVVHTEPEVELHVGSPRAAPYFFHRPCYVLWLAEVLRS